MKDKKEEGNVNEKIEAIKQIRHYDERGYFQELIKSTDDFFVGFGQWSLSFMNQGVVKSWHIHLVQHDYWAVIKGNIKAVVCDMRHTTWPDLPIPQNVIDNLKFEEYLMGENYEPIILHIPPGVAHGLKVLQGPAVLMYITSEMYDPADEGRIPYNSLGYNWDERVIK